MPVSAAATPTSSISPSSLTGAVFGRFTGRRQQHQQPPPPPPQSQPPPPPSRQQPTPPHPRRIDPPAPSSASQSLRRPLQPDATDLNLPVPPPGQGNDSRALSISTHNLPAPLGPPPENHHTAADNRPATAAVDNVAPAQHPAPPLSGPRRSSTTPTHSPAHSVSHSRRESAILSLATSVTDLGASVRRSVSLRSHRTNLSNGGSPASKAWSPASASSTNIFSPLAASPVDSPDGSNQIPQLPSAPPPPAPTAAGLSTSPPTTAPSRRQRSLSRTISNKFKSTENLAVSIPTHRPPPDLPSLTPTASFTSPINPTTTTSTKGRPPLSMLAVGIPQASAPRMDKGPLNSQNSYTRDSPSNPTLLHPSNANPVPHASASLHPTSSGANPQAIYHQILETSAKRIATIEYLRKVHEGDIFYFSTVHFLQSSFASTMPSLYPHKLGRRATGYFILGYSLPALLDMNATSPLDLLKALSALLQEFETYQSLAGYDASGNSLSRGRVGQMLKSGMGLGGLGGRGRRSSVATENLALDTRTSDSLSLPRPSMTSTHTSTSTSTSIPTPTSATSTSVSDYYAALSPSSDPGPSPISSGPSIPNHDFTHLLLPHLGFEPDFHATFATLCDTLVDAYAKLIDLVTHAQANVEPTSPALAEAFAKADKSVRKILVANVVREFEDATRHAVKTEVAGLGKVVLGALI